MPFTAPPRGPVRAIAPSRSRAETLAEYAIRWLAMRVLAPKTVELYESELRCHILPTFGDVGLDALATEQIRVWYADRVRATSAISAAKCYRLLSAMLTTAVEDGLILRNPCKLKGAGRERSRERPLLTAAEVLDVADGIDPRYRALVLLAAYGSLRRGELLGLRRRDIDLERAVVTVEGQAQLIRGVGRVITNPKSEAGRRSVALPAVVAEAVRRHMSEFTAANDDAWVFTAERGGPAREGHVRAEWNLAAAAAGVPDAHLHDLRHFGATLAAQLGATTRELQDRLGHSTTRAAMLYQHRAHSRDQELADRMDASLTAQIAERQPRLDPAEHDQHPGKTDQRAGRN